MHSLAQTYLKVVFGGHKHTSSVQLLCKNFVHLNSSQMASNSEGDQRSQQKSSRPSIHSSHIDDIHEVPIGIIKRPIPPVLDEDKVESLMQTYKQNPDQIPPIDVMWIEGSEGGNYYFSFGGCHRFDAAKRLGLQSIKCKLFKSNVDDLRFYMGSSTPDLK